jgi:hypothetical protein
MPDPGAVAATRVALLELRDERRLVQEGYDLLDEKRVLLASETLRELREHVAAQRDLDTDWAAARAALARAVEIHGFDDLTVEPPCPLDLVPLRVEVRSFLGIPLGEVHLEHTPCRTADPPVRDTPELARPGTAGGAHGQPAAADGGVPPDRTPGTRARERTAAGNRRVAAFHRRAARCSGPGRGRPRPQRRPRALTSPCSGLDRQAGRSLASVAQGRTA